MKPSLTMPNIGNNIRKEDIQQFHSKEITPSEMIKDVIIATDAGREGIIGCQMDLVDVWK